MQLKAVLCSLAILPAIVLAKPQSYVIVAPNCLLEQAAVNGTVMATTKKVTLLSTNNAGLRKLLVAKVNQTKLCGGFMDVSQAWADYVAQTVTVNPQQFLAPYEMKDDQNITGRGYTIQYPDQVNSLLKEVNPQMMWNNLTKLTNFHNRYANSDTGVEASGWIKAQVEKLASDNHRDDISVYTVKTGRYKQDSVVVKIGKSNEPGIVLGAHMDTIAMFENRQPGADDDGSGTVTALETIRTLITSGMKFKKPIYFAWYAAEEEGLVGSQYVVAHFKKEQIPVDAVLHFDMTGYAHRNDNTMFLISDYVNSDLTKYLETLIKTYVKQPIKYTRCGYACSDHATWTKNGFPAAISFESAFETSNQAIHSSRDTMEKLNQAHMTDYVKLGVAFAVELAEPTT